MKSGQKIIIIRTELGYFYGDRIKEQVNNLGVECGDVFWGDIDEYFKENGITPNNSLLHFRTAGPHVNTGAFELEKQGFRVINKPEVLSLTSDKFRSFMWAKEKGLELPFTMKGTPESLMASIPGLKLAKFVLKPINSKAQGEFCFSSFAGDVELDRKLSKIPGGEVILQEFVNYLRIYRVIVINGEPLNSAVFSDEPTAEQWKVSVCLNPDIKHVVNPDPQLLCYAKKAAEIFGSEVAFIDIFETKNGYVLSEINTACNLCQHEDKSGYKISADIARYLVSQNWDQSSRSK